MNVEMTTAALEGYYATPCAYLVSSPKQMAWDVGRYLNVAGYPAPLTVTMSRGYSLKVNGSLILKWLGKGKVTP